MLGNCCTSRMVYVWTALVTLLLGGSLFLAFWGIPRIIRSQVHSQTRLTNGTEQWDRFEELPFPLNYSIRFFLVQNADDVLNKGSKPILHESEPYTYELTIKKTNIHFDDFEEDSVTYKRQLTFKFKSSGKNKETDKITIINPLLMASLQMSSGIERIAMAGCLDVLLGPTGLDQVFLTTTVKQILFKGVTFSWANATGLGVACEIVRQKMIETVANIRVIEHITDSYPDYLRIALFNYKTDDYVKNSPDGIYTINRGIDDMYELGKIMRWNGAGIIPTYGNEQSSNLNDCQQLRGTDSTIYPPELEEGKGLTIYNTDICRVVDLVYVSSNTTFKGIKAHRYETSKRFFRPSTLDKEKDCYCAKATKDASGKDNCYLDGLFDFKPCLGAPALVSQPHFLNADSHYLENVKGLKPNESKHGIYLLLEPNTGTPFEGMKRIQINSVLRKEDWIHNTPSTMHEGIVPLLWLEEGVSLPQKYVDQLNNQYFKKVKIATGLKYGLIALFAALLAGCLFLVLRKVCSKNK